MSDGKTPLVIALDPLQLAFSGMQVIEASAGTGKTYTITSLYVRLVLGHCKAGEAKRQALLPSQILVMTFTEVATAELRARIRERLRDAARLFADAHQKGGDGGLQEDHEDQFLHELIKSYRPDELLACAKKLEEASQWMDEAAIYTIHGWSSRMLRQHAFDSTSLFNQSRVQSSEQLQLIAVQDYWRKRFYSLTPLQIKGLRGISKTPQDLLKKLQQIWREKEKTPSEEVRIERTPTEIFQEWGKWNEALETLQKEARTAWTDELADLVRAKHESKVIKGLRTDYLARWLEYMRDWKNGAEVGRDKLERFSASSLKKKGWVDAADFHAFNLIDQLCDLHEHEPDCKEELLRHAAFEVGQAYANTKSRLAQFDFSDLLQALYFALHKAESKLPYVIRRQYPVALVDEFQDTDPWQYGSLQKIYGDAPKAATALVMIGDPKQAIYSFRGADLATYLRARNSAQNICTLTGNYRSSKFLVQAVNHVFQRADRPFGEVDFIPVSACKDVALLKVGGHDLPAMSASYVEDEFSNAQSFRMALSEVCATRIAELLNQSALDAFKGELPEIVPAKMAVLVRDRFEAASIGNALARRGINSVYLSESDSVFKTEEAKDLLRILQAVAAGGAERKLRGAVATRLWGLKLPELEKLVQDDARWDALTEQFQTLQKIWQQQGILPMLQNMLHAQGLPARLMSQKKVQGRSVERRLTNLLHLGDLLQAASNRLQGESALIRYLEEQIKSLHNSSDAVQLRMEGDADLVQIVTMHKSKGLEYPLVFLPFVSDAKSRGSGQAKEAKSDSASEEGGSEVDGNLAEDIRLLYVAFTRAKQSLWVGLASRKGEFKNAISVLLGRKTAEDFLECTLAWAECESIKVQVASAPNLVQYQAHDVAAKPKPALVPARKIVSNWWTASFSALARKQHHSLDQSTHIRVEFNGERDVQFADAQLDNTRKLLEDDQQEGSAIKAGSSRFNSFAAGSSYGTFLHDLLEWQASNGWPILEKDHNEKEHASWTNLLERKAQRLNLVETDIRMVEEWMRQIASFIQLSFNPAREICEMGFALSVEPIHSSQIDSEIKKHILKGKDRDSLDARLLDGMLIGFMDLVFESNGRYFVLDYKSNRLPSYEQNQLETAMLEHRYDVQLTIYVLALHRLLRARLPDYDYEMHMGGAIYLFLRGVATEGDGVFSLLPPRALIESLDALISARSAQLELAS